MDVIDSMEDLLDHGNGVDDDDESYNSHQVDNVEDLDLFLSEGSMGIAYHDVPRKKKMLTAKYVITRGRRCFSVNLY